MKFTKLIALLMAAGMLAAQLAACGVDPNGDGDDTDAEQTDGETTGYSAGLDENGFIKGIKATDYVKLPKYKGIDIDKKLIEADEEDVQTEIDNLLARYDSYVEITDENVAIEDGDTVNIDYIGYIDDVQFDGGNTGGLGTDVTIGVTQYIDDFLEQLIGHHPGEKFDIFVTFPDDYGKEELNGKEARFAITINHIHGDVIKAEMNAEMAKNYGFNSVEELVADIKEYLVGNERFYFFVDLLAEVECEEVPEKVIEYIQNLDLLGYEYYAASYGYSTEDYILMTSGAESMEAYFESMQENYKKDAVLYLAAQAIAEIEGITATTEEVMADYSDYLSTYGEPYLKQFILFQHKIPAFIAENGKVAD